MRNDRAGWRTLGPKPDKRNSFHAMRFEGKKQQPLHQIFHRAINGPAWERNIRPSPEVKSLNVPPDVHGQQGSNRIVHASDERRGWSVHSIPLASQVLYDLCRIKRQTQHRILYRYVLQGIVKPRVRDLDSHARRRLTEADYFGTKLKIAGFAG